MLREEVLEKLCYYDDRNPNNDLETYDVDDMIDLNKRIEEKWCSCDNCFYGRTNLAEELLKHMNA